MKKIFEELEIPEEWQDEFISWEVEFHDCSGSSGDMVYGYYFSVPEEANIEFLKVMEWKLGESVELSINALDQEE